MEMAKKDFKDIENKVVTQRVATVIDTATGKRGQQAAADLEEQIRRKAAGKTQGRKGCSKGGSRINLLLTDENHQFITVMARATGKSMTDFINGVITAYRNEHPEFLEQAENFINFVNAGLFSNKEED